MIDPELLELLVCPADRGSLTEEAGHLVCSVCGRRYPVTDGIPVMIIDEAVPPRSGS